MGEHAALTAARWNIGRARAGRTGRRQPPQARRRLRPRLLRAAGHPLPRPGPRPEPPPRLHGREARRAQARVRRPGRHHDRGQLHPAHRRRGRRPARERGVGARARADPAGVPDGVRDRRRRLRVRAGGAADGARLRRTAHARPRRAGPGRLRPLRDPRGVRLPGAGHARRVGGQGVLRGAARARRAARVGRPGAAQHAGSSLATGHPFAATGARIVATLAGLLAEREGPGAGSSPSARRAARA